MKILGLGYKIFHNSAASVVDESGKIIFAASEERFSRIKLDSAEPLKTLNYIKKNYDYNFVTSSYYDMKRILRERFATTQSNKQIKNMSYFVSLFPNKFLKFGKAVNQLVKYRKIEKNKTDKIIDYYSGHQDSHAASAYYTSGFNKSLILTWDGGINCEPWLISIQHGNNNEMKRIFMGNRKYDCNKTAWKYSGITRLLGFKPNRHEGKITGLAAYGKHNEKCINDLKKALFNKSFNFYYDKIFDELTWFRDKYTKEDIAYAIQYLTEQEVIARLNKIRENYDYNNICLAGGLFANVRINQKIRELGFKEIFIHPAMGDEGLGVGSALFYLGKEQNLKPYKLDDVYFGPGYTNEEIRQELEKTNLTYHHNENIELEIAELLAKGEVIARFNGRMEYGPRALGNRSILYQATDPSANDWLNKKLVRTEFMPFAPVTLNEYATKCYKNLGGAEYAAKFMTITFDCTDYMKKNMPAVVHIDGTARPQLIDKKTNPSYYTILNEYRKITKLPSIVNTSFNMHEEPIVMTPGDAIRSFKQGHLKYLAIGNYLVKSGN